MLDSGAKKQEAASREPEGERDISQAGRRTDHARSRTKCVGKRRKYPRSRTHESGSIRQQTERRRQQLSVLIGRETTIAIH